MKQFVLKAIRLFDVIRGARGGGVAFYIKSHFHFSILGSNNEIEQLWLLISLRGRKIAFGVVYNPHRRYYASFIDSLESTLSTIIIQTNDIFCFGDFNVDLLDATTAAAACVLECFESLGLTQLINEPTRITPESATLLDYIVTSNTDIVINYSVVFTHDSLDHSMICCVISAPHTKPAPVIRKYRNFKNFDFTQFEYDLRSLPWNNIYDLNNIDDKVTFITDNLEALLNLHAPLCTSRITKQPAPWLTDTLKQMMRLRDRALSHYKTTKKPEHFNYYKMIRNQVTNAVKREKKAYYSTIFRQNSKFFWNNLKSDLNFNSAKKEIPAHISNPDEVNKHFIEAVPKSQVDSNNLINFYRTHLKNSVKSLLKFEPVDEIEILKIISSIKTKSSGTDGITISIISYCVPFLLPYITHVINYCLINSVFPSNWKKAIITPIPKSSSVKELKDLRPISLLPVLSKIIERIMERQLQIHLQNNHILPVNQSGYRKGHSCSTALLHIVDDVISMTDQGKITLLILLDYSKAFDTIDHNILMSILHYIGLDPSAISLMVNYFSDRYQAVRLGGSLSDFLKINSGVPQGSILGPILFSIYISNFSVVLRNCESHFYADDSQLYFSFEPSEVHNACLTINRDLDRLAYVSEQHALKLNPGKSAVMIFGKKHLINLVKEEVDIRIGNDRLPLVDSAKSLGLTLDSSLRFNKHISNCLQSAYCNLRAIFRNRFFFNTQIKTLLCNSLVLSKVDFCDTVYGPCLDYKDTRRIQKLQNSCLRMIFGIRKFERISYKLRDVNWLNMINRRVFHSTCLFHKILTDRTPPYLYNKITFRTDVHNLNLRFRGNISIPRHFSEFAKRSFTYCIANIYNKLEQNLKTLPLPRFRVHLKKLLIEKQLELLNRQYH